MINTQIAEGKERDAEHVFIHHAWDTIQGEGPFVGMPAVFVRLAGCNLQCPMCDTDYTSKRKAYSMREAVDLVKTIRAFGLVVITGGEPFRQASLAEFIARLRWEGYLVQIETNGTLFQPMLYDGLVVVCSPKAPTVHKDLHRHISAWKYVLQAGHVDPGDGLPTSVLDNGLRPARPPATIPLVNVYVQPADTGDPITTRLNLDAALASCRRYGYRLCLQTHKMIGLE